MTAHFDDHKSLAFAFADLVQAGFAEDRMSADFGTPPDAETLPHVHVSLLERLHRLADRLRTHAAQPRHTPHRVLTESADLTLDPGDHTDAALAIITRHGGTVTA